MEIILIIYLVVSIALIGIILLQQGKGAEMGASFGAGGANTVFGAAGSGNALTKATTILTILFFAIALSISYMKSAPVDTTDAVLDEVSSLSTDKVEESKPVTSIESELPPTQKGLESEVAPVEGNTADAQKTVAEDLKATAEKKVEKKVEDVKASAEKKLKEVKEETKKENNPNS
ncbi:preprotein translocase subunit SecG [Aliikangiella sp. IMCC44359]|uniref:preprotein translocase subunit SecG n=1 Tax=Aliikangiella sp. IMCC44359 TaxID=3459125 RepID=UPI00403B280C